MSHMRVRDGIGSNPATFAGSDGGGIVRPCERHKGGALEEVV